MLRVEEFPLRVSSIDFSYIGLISDYNQLYKNYILMFMELKAGLLFKFMMNKRMLDVSKTANLLVQKQTIHSTSRHLLPIESAASPDRAATPREGAVEARLRRAEREKVKRIRRAGKSFHLLPGRLSSAAQEAGFRPSGFGNYIARSEILGRLSFLMFSEDAGQKFRSVR